MRIHRLVLCLLLCGCATASRTALTPEESPVQAIDLSASDTGRTVQAKPGDVVSVRLAENPTTGYQWVLDMTPPDAWQATSTPFAPDGAGRIGGEGTRTWLLTALAPGETRVVFSLQRRWGGGAPTRRVEFVLVVR